MTEHSATEAMWQRRPWPLVLLPVLALGGCFLLADPPPDPSVAPLEVVVDSSKVAEQCLLNRESVAAGTHEVTLLTEGRAATVRVLDELGDVVFTGQAVPGEGEGAGGPEGPPSVQLSAGEHTVECSPEGGSPVTVPLHVDP